MVRPVGKHTDLVRLEFTIMPFAGICSTTELPNIVEQIDNWTNCNVIELEVSFPLIHYCQLQVIQLVLLLMCWNLPTTTLKLVVVQVIQLIYLTLQTTCFLREQPIVDGENSSHNCQRLLCLFYCFAVSQTTKYHFRTRMIKHFLFWVIKVLFF